MDNISNLVDKFKSHIELQEYCDAQYKIIQTLTNEKDKLVAEVENLKNMLGGAVPMIEVEKPKPALQVSPEQSILEMQIVKMQGDAMSRQLTLEETKRLDLLIKNLHLVKGQSTQIVENKFQGNFSEAELVRIACQSESPAEE